MPTITDSEFGEIVVKKQGLAKNISLRIAPDGRLRVTMPSYAPLLAAKTVIKTSRLQIRKLLDQHQLQFSYTKDQQIGKSHSLIIRSTAGATTVKTAGTRIIASINENEDIATAANQQLIRQKIAAALRKEAKSYLPRRLSFLAEEHGFSFKRTKITHASSRWGSCSSTGTISLNIALMNLLTMEQGKGRFVMMDDAMWGMILGKSGKIPGTIAPELVALAKEKGFEFTDADPHTLLPNSLDEFKKEMDENGWEYGQDDEELFELAMHPEQYRNYKSGQAKKNFLADLQKAKDAKMGSKLSVEELAAFKHAKADALVAPVKGQLFWEFNGDGECAPTVEPYIGKEYKEGEVFCYIVATWGEIVTVPAALGGKLVEINAKQGSKVNKGDVVAYIERAQ